MILRVFLILVPLLVAADATRAADVESRVKDVDHTNRTARLAGVAISPARGRNYSAKFVEIAPNRGKQFSVTFPAHSFTTHEATLINLIQSSVVWGKDPAQWHETQFDVVFSMPQDAEGYVTDYRRWYLSSLKRPEQKKDQPEPRAK
jgi:hypothetical protein